MKLSRGQWNYILLVSVLMGFKNLPNLYYDPFLFFGELVGGALVTAFLIAVYNYVREGLAE